MFTPPALQQENKVVSVPSPVGGLNAKDSIVAMPETDALILQNWWPQPYGCSVRKGYREWATGLPADGATLASWASATGTQKLFVWAGTDVYDISTAGPVGAPLVTGLTNSIWDWVNLVNAADSHLIALNGFDDGIIYNTSGGNRVIAGDGIVPNTWAGINPKNAVCPVVHQHRLWVVEKNTTNGWFLPPDAIQGTFLKYNFGPLFSKGGFLQFLATWTMDDGNGAEDHLIAVSSRGEAVVYSGTDPEDDTKWFLTGVYFIGAPVSGRRAYCKAGGDQYILTQQGIVSMASMLVSTKVSEKAKQVTTDKVQFLISELTAQFSQLFGWDLKYYPKENQLILNLPSIVAGGNIQLASNQITNAWTQFRDMDATCWGSFGSSPMFCGFDSTVYQAWVGFTDKLKLDGTGGVGIVSNVHQAYSYLQTGPLQKQIGLYRPVFVITSPITVKTKILYDFVTETVSAPTPLPITSGSLWGTGIWGTSTWGGGDAVQKQWIQAEGMGVAASFRMVLQTEVEVLWIATDYSYKVGAGIL